MSTIKSSIAMQIHAADLGQVWVPSDFAQFGKRDAVDKSLQRLTRAGTLRRIGRGLYDKPAISGLTKRPTSPDYRAVVDAIARRDQLRLLVDGMTAANDLGLTDAVPARVIISTDARHRAIHIGNLTINFKHTAPSRLYWAGRPAMRVVQALYWLKDTIETDRARILDRLSHVLAEPAHGETIGRDLREGFQAMPAWMQNVVRELPGCDPQLAAGNSAGKRPAAATQKRRPVVRVGTAQ